MVIGSITSTNRMSSMQTTAADLKGQKSKNIQNEITSTQQQMRKLSSKEDLSANEKTNKRKELQKEISSLNTELKQYQDELRRSQKRELMMAELQEDRETAREDKPKDKIQPEKAVSNSADEEKLQTDNEQSARQGTVITQNTDGTVILKESPDQNRKPGVDAEDSQTDEAKEEAQDQKEQESKDNDIAANTSLSGKEIHAMAAADSSLEQANRLGTVVAKTRNGIAILKGEINQDENLGTDTSRKQAALEKMEKQEQRATAVQSSLLGEANHAAKQTAEANTSAKDGIQANIENMVNAWNVFQEEEASQPKFFVSVG